MRDVTVPGIIFTSKKPFDDRFADDMQYGDMSEHALKNRYHLGQVSTYIDWGNNKAPYPHPALANLPAISKHKTVRMLFDELRAAARYFSFTGAYRGMASKLFNHMQYNSGMDFHDSRMDMSYRELILSDVTENSTLIRIKKTLDTFNFNAHTLTPEVFSAQLSRSRLPKYTRWKDCVNGLGISVHDINSTQISITALTLQKNRYRAVIHYKAQDHFGLDKEDIIKLRFNALSLFRIWFVLQRYEKFAFKPFFTNFEATFILEGEIYAR